MITMPIELYTDGSCLKNPGIGGCAYIIRYWWDNIPEGTPNPSSIEFNQGFRLTTNNRMEIMAVIYGLNAIIDKINDTLKGATQINVFSDSEYFCNAVNQRWIQKWMQNNWMTSGFKGSAPKPVKNKDLWEQVIQIQNKLQSLNIILTITHVKGHSGNELNEEADKLAVAASKGSNHIADEAYEKTMTIYNKR